MGAAPARTRAGPAGTCAHAPAGGVGAVAARTAEGRRHRIPRVTSVQAIGVSAGRRTFGGASVNAVGVGTPAALFLLVLLPVVAALARRRVAPRGALALRLLVVTLVVTALASPYLSTRGGDLTVVLAVDLPASVCAEQRQAAQEFVRSAAGHRRPGDRVGLVTFGAGALPEELPNPHPRLAFATQPVATGTALGQAIRAALAALPEEGAKRIVLLTDGNDNRGSLADALALARSGGVEVSAVPLAAGGAAEVLVDDVEAPQEVVAGEQFAVKVAVLATTAASVRLTITAGNTIVDRRTIEVPPGRTIVTVPQVARREGLLSYEGSITADPDGTDANNRAEATVMVRGKPVVWYVARQPGVLARLLTAQGVRVRNLPPEALPVTAAGLRETAAVILDDVPAIRLSPAQTAALRDYVGRLGGGLIAVGGPNSYGVGGYAGTPLEEVLPVSMDVRHRLAIPSMAIILIIDTSGSMGAFGTQIAKVELAKETAQSVIDLLGERDLLGVISFDQEARWLAVPTEARNRDRVMEQVSRMQAGGGTNMYPAIRLAFDYLRRSPAKVRHVIVLSDGQTDPGDFQTLLRRMAADKITTSAVAIGADADLELMQHVARWGGGRSYATRDLYTIPQILTAEALIASRAYLVEERFTPQTVRAGLVRWASRGETDDLQVAVDHQGDAATVIADAVTADGTPLDGLDVQAGISGPVSTQIPLVQTAPGRYEARAQLTAPGAYALAVTARDTAGRVRVRTAGFVVPYSPELRDLTVNRALLAHIAETTGGRLLDDPAAAVVPVRTTRSAANSWPLFAGTALGLFVVEISVRRMPAVAHQLGMLLGAVRSRGGKPPTAQGVEEERQYAEAARWKVVEPDAAASGSMEQAGRLYIARLKAGQEGDRRRRGEPHVGGADSGRSAGTPTPAPPARGGARERDA